MSHKNGRLLPARAKSTPELHYTIDETVASGSFGVLRPVKDRRSGRKRIMKTLCKKDVEDKEALRLELSIQARLDYPHICKLYDHFDVGGRSGCVHIVMESCCGGELADVIEEMNEMPEADAHHVSTQVMKAVAYMHGRGIAHRDLKPENVLLKSRGVPLLENVVKLVDFGFAQFFEHGASSMTTKCGTPLYTAPEIWRESTETFSEKVDVWSCGVMLYVMLAGEPPFEGENNCELARQVIRGRLDFSGEAWQDVTPAAKASILHMCRVNPKLRFSAAEVL